MKINLETIPENANDGLRDFAVRKVERLGKFYDRIVETDVYLKSGSDASNPCVAELRVNVPGDTLYCEEKAPSFEEAIDSASHVMERQVKKFKQTHADFPHQH